MRALTRRRSCLTVPGGSEKMLRKAAVLAADEVLLDLEDAVAPDDKVRARLLVTGAVGAGLYAGRNVAIRINAATSPWQGDDIAALTELRAPDISIVLPKIRSAAELIATQRRLDAAGVAYADLQVLVETALGLVRCGEIAASSERLSALILGYGDLAASLGRTGEASWTFARETMLLASRAFGVQAIDGPCFDLGPESERHAADCATTAAMGYDGKWAIHPGQVATIDAAFTPSATDLARARGILAALDRAAAHGQGAAEFEGAMIDAAMRRGALNVLSKVQETTWI